MSPGRGEKAARHPGDNLVAESFDGNTGVFISGDPIAVIDVR